ncbi:MmcQ/YjbR family DNA-binding protein [Homoserinimonas hongtaonis]|uniref:MmcQ/YjbR family DNA-binding protein n=1 Tax=Homoserinimonas hongtaonis TaxID=2079791 RepID=A0A2U1T0B5_9MICO|nr:MmcQ/YjbR family DNA-binding protein [Salinibacterium hongtaonis]AWB89860.1 DNA-binding protein [Salinibacterium hongtaonis]PWB97324.1 MmcQ/YjbR family DNA-binding protein [Salinibacterium hongtaonis]
MTPDALQELCLSLPQAIETFPFDNETSVFKTSGNGRIFALSNLGADVLTVSLKCDPEDSVALREEFAEITPGYHLNKKHWITVVVSADPSEGVPDDLVEDLIIASHELVRPKVRAPKRAVAED